MSLPFKCLSRISWRIETSNKFATNKKKHSLKYHISSKLPLVLDKPKFEVIFEDEWLLVINKPSGIKHEPVHRFMGGSLVNQVTGYLGKEPFTYHRLDMFTSGVIVFGKCKDILKPLMLQNKAGKVEKRYLLICVGIPACKKFVVNAPIGRNPDHTFGRQVREDGKEASTEFCVLSTNENFGVSLLEAKLLTGRTHQIRVHCQYSKLPILGDEIYGSVPILWDGVYGINSSFSISPSAKLAATGKRDMKGLTSGKYTEKLILLHSQFVEEKWNYMPKEPMRRQALHAWSLEFSHPITGDNCSFQAEPPIDFMAALSHFQLLKS